MSAPKKFKEQYEKYLTLIKKAHTTKVHHDQLRSLFLDFISKAFNAKPEEFELEKGIKLARIHGFIDVLYQDIIFEFKKDFEAERDKGLYELTTYLKSQANVTYFGVLTDGLIFEVYILKDGKLERIDRIVLNDKLSIEEAFTWFDAYLFSEKELTPTCADVVKRFGDSSPVFNSSYTLLNKMLAQAKDDPSLKVKYSEWDKLLAKAYGHSVARDELFLRHTYLTLLVKLLAYSALFKEKPKGEKLADIIRGKAFTNLPNLVEEDFFCWVLAPVLAPSASELLHGLAQHLTVYDLTKVDEDLLKELYENLVDSETKHDLGEVYTPDWLVELTLREAGFSAGKSMLDPACGSGTFLFTAIRLLKEHGLKGGALVDTVKENIVGVDVHPVAVTISKANYVLALANDLKDYGKPLLLPVYMADSLSIGDPTGGELTPVYVDGKDFFNIPRIMARNPTNLDEVIDEMRKYVAINEEKALDGFAAFLKNKGFEELNYIWRHNIKLMRKLIKQGRDTIWGFILKNYYRPTYLCYRKFDIVAGNPPWLAYKYITDPIYQQEVKKLVFRYDLLTKKDMKLFADMEVATVFFALSADQYLKKDGDIALVLPRSTIIGAKQHVRFQNLLKGYHTTSIGLVKVLDTDDVSPLFKVPCCVLIAHKNGGTINKLSKHTITGKLPYQNIKLSEAKNILKVVKKEIEVEKFFPKPPSPSIYLKHIKRGADIYPRSFWFIKPISSPYGINKTKPALETTGEVQKIAKKPWVNICIKGEVEADYLYITALGSQLLPFGVMGYSSVIVPIKITPTGIKIVKKESALENGHSGLYDWLNQVETIWDTRKKERTKENIYQWIDYLGKLTSQYLSGYYTLTYNRVGTNLARC